MLPTFISLTPGTHFMRCCHTAAAKRTTSNMLSGITRIRRCRCVCRYTAVRSNLSAADSAYLIMCTVIICNILSLRAAGFRFCESARHTGCRMLAALTHPGAEITVNCIFSFTYGADTGVCAVFIICPIGISAGFRFRIAAYTACVGMRSDSIPLGPFTVSAGHSRLRRALRTGQHMITVFLRYSCAVSGGAAFTLNITADRTGTCMSSIIV